MSTLDWNWLTRFLLGKDGRNGNIVMCTGWESGARVYVGHIVQLETAYNFQVSFLHRIFSIFLNEPANKNEDTMNGKATFYDGSQKELLIII